MSLSNLPLETLLEDVLPLLPVKDVLSFGATNKAFATACEDGAFWKQKVQEDFNFSGEKTARTTGWRFIYKKLSSAELFVWGENGGYRLGLPDDVIPRPALGKIPYPVPLRIPGVRIVEVAAGGWSLYFLDSKGQLFVSGTLDDEGLHGKGFAAPATAAQEPYRLQLPSPVRALSCGRKHLMTLDANRHVWTWLSWGRPARMATPMLDGSSPESTPRQIEAGWSFCSVLTEAGDVVVWFPWETPFRNIHRQNMWALDKPDQNNSAVANGGVIPCVPWDCDAPVCMLPPLPALPDLPHDPSTSERLGRDDATKLVKIACMDNQLVGLTNKGHVLKYSPLVWPESIELGDWEYLPLFSDSTRLASNPTYKKPELTAPQYLRITHILAHFRTFTAYSPGDDSVVLLGNVETTAQTPAKVIPELQNKGVISVVLGDYHYGALTSDGKLYTWGSFSAGALGLGDPGKLEPSSPGGFMKSTGRRRFNRYIQNTTVPNVEVPTEVRFDHQLQPARKARQDHFCVAATAAGWHMAALAFSLSDNDK